MSRHPASELTPLELLSVDPGETPDVEEIARLLGATETLLDRLPPEKFRFCERLRVRAEALTEVLEAALMATAATRPGLPLPNPDPSHDTPQPAP